MKHPKFDYAQMDLEERPFAQRLALYMSVEFPGTVVDLGAGTGVYVQELHRCGVVAQGYDPCDQPQPTDLVTQASMLAVTDSAHTVLCLEVAEHIESHLSRQVIQALWRCCRPGGHVIFSAAQPGQGGVGHINCQAPEYWQQLAEAQGFQRHSYREWHLDQWILAGYHMGWFARNRQIWHRPRDTK